MEFFSQSLSMECKNKNIVVQTVTPGFIKAQENSNESIFSCMLPNMTNFVRNTIDSVGISQRITGSWLFSMEVSSEMLIKFINSLIRCFF